MPGLCLNTLDQLPEPTTLPLPGQDDPTWQAYRATAFQALKTQGLPTRHLESWKYINLSGLKQPLLELAQRPPQLTLAQIAPLLPKSPCLVLVFVNGHLDLDLSDKTALASLKLTSLFDLSAPPPLTSTFQDGLEALNAAYRDAGTLFNFPADLHLEKPLHCLFLSTYAHRPYLACPYYRFTLAEHASLDLSFQFSSLEGNEQIFCSNALIEIYLENSAQLNLCQWQTLPQDPHYHFCDIRVHLDEKAQFNHSNYTLGAKLARDSLTLTLKGNQAKASLGGCYLARFHQYHDRQILIHHLGQSTQTNTAIKGVATHQAHGVFLGRIKADREALQTQATLTNKNLLLSNQAEIDTRPELEIDTQEILCSHGATLGNLDEEALFFLRCAGLSEAEARRLLVEAFLLEPLTLNCLPTFNSEIKMQFEKIFLDLEKEMIS